MPAVASPISIEDFANRVRDLPMGRRHGSVVETGGLCLAIAGLGRSAAIGARVEIVRDGTAPLLAEIVAATADRAIAMPFEAAIGVAPGARVDLLPGPAAIAPSAAWLGRCFDGLGRASDGNVAPVPGPARRLVRSGPPPAATRARLGQPLETGIAAVDLFTPIAEGQRLGLFAGSGVGKSVLSGMFARFAAADVIVIGLIGERGRELREFIEDELGAEGLSRAVIVSATSDESPVMRRQAAWTTMAVAEHFRDTGARVLCLMDSVTRFAHACREIGLAAGEPPTTRGYTPSVFAELPRLLERAGPGQDVAEGRMGSITGLFSVLVEGGDMEEPIADAVRGILDGHLILDRRIAARGRYPAIDLLGSLSRTADRARSAAERALLARARNCLSTWDDMQELVRLGAYKSGANADVDAAIARAPHIEALCAQPREDRRNRMETIAALEEILS
ncbi:MAG: FliI/YscN family ATPase [Pseudomonadota bacterium]